jgi:pimeloyl-ACP methyl ester carboxylesterase
MSQARWIVCGAFVMLFATLGSSPVAGGAGRADAAAVAAPRAEAQASGAAIAWRACGNRLQCARVRVPLDWSRATVRAGRVVSAGPTISLAVIRYRASSRRRRIGSLFFNFGGPGVAATPNVRAAGAAFDGLAGGRFDIVGWDPRGTGDSTHVRCFADRRSMLRFWGADWSIPTTPLESRRYVPKTVDYARRCAARSGRLLEHVSTADSVRDLDYLRRLVGDRRLNYRGESYGTFLGQTYANMFPRRVGRMVLDALIDPVPFTRSVEAGLASSEAESDLVFEKFLSLCQQAGPARCALAGQGPVAPRARALLARLRRGPIPAPSAASRQLSYGDTLLALWQGLAAPENWPKLAAELNQAANGDGSALANTVGGFKPDAQESLVAATALQCADKPLPRPDAVNAWPTLIDRLSERNLVAPVDLWWLWAPCASWRTASANRYTGPWTATTPNPVLVIGNRYDPRTAYANAPVAARRLGNAVLLTNNGYGHTSSSDLSDCTIEATTRYLTTLATPRNGTVCQPNHRPFEPDFGQ